MAGASREVLSPDEEDEPGPIEEMAGRVRTSAYLSAAPPALR